MQLKEAYICLDCEEIFDLVVTKGACPACASKIFAPVSGWLRSVRLEMPARQGGNSYVARNRDA